MPASRSKYEYKLLDEAVAAYKDVPAWMAFRFTFAQQYNQHKPQGVQVHTKRRALDIATDLVSGLGGAIMAPPPPGLSSDPNWVPFCRIADRLTADMKTALLRTICTDKWGNPYLPGAVYDHKRAEQMSQLASLLLSMEIQQRANAAGWVIGAGWRARRPKGGSKASSRRRAPRK